MAILKTSLRIIFLVLLCVPIVYMEYCIIKKAIADVMNIEKRKSAKTNTVINNYYKEEYLRVAK